MVMPSELFLFSLLSFRQNAFYCVFMYQQINYFQNLLKVTLKNKCKNTDLKQNKKSSDLYY